MAAVSATVTAGVRGIGRIQSPTGGFNGAKLPDLMLTVAARRRPVSVRDVLTCSFTVANKGPGTSTGVK